MCGAHCGRFTAAKSAGCKDSVHGGRIFCQQTSQINIHFFAGGPFLYIQSFENERAILQVQVEPSSTAASNLIFLGQDTIQHCWIIFIFLLLEETAKSMQRVTEEAGWSFPECSNRDHCGQSQMRLDRLWCNAQVFKVLQVSVLSISFATLRLQSEGSGKGAAQAFEILSRRVRGE